MVIISSSTVTKNSLITQAYANIYNLLNSRSNVPDPISSSGERQLVYTRMPKFLNVNFDGCPFIAIIRPELDGENAVVSGTKSWLTWKIKVVIGGTDDTVESTGYVDSLSDSILKTLNNISNRSALRNYGMSMFDFSSSFDEVDLNDKTLYLREFTLTFKRMLVIA